MHRMSAQETSLSRLASRQHGVVVAQRSRGAGLIPRQIERRAADGRLCAVHRGVYAVGHAALSREGRWMAAVLACGDGGGAQPSQRGGLLALHGPRGPRAARDRAASRAARGRGGAPGPARAGGRDGAQRHPGDVAGANAGRPGAASSARRTWSGSCARRSSAGCSTRRPSATPCSDARAPLCGSSSTTATRASRSSRTGSCGCAAATASRGRRRRSAAAAVARISSGLTRASIVEVDSWQAHGTQHAFQADRTLSNAVQLAGWTILRFTYADVTRRPRPTSPRSSARRSV